MVRYISLQGGKHQYLSSSYNYVHTKLSQAEPNTPSHKHISVSTQISGTTSFYMKIENLQVCPAKKNIEGDYIVWSRGFV